MGGGGVEKPCQWHEEIMSLDEDYKKIELYEKLLGLESK